MNQMAHILERFAGLTGPLSQRRQAPLHETARVTAVRFPHSRYRVQAETSRRSRLGDYTPAALKQQPRKATQRRKTSKAASADPQADIRADPNAEPGARSSDITADSPDHLFAAARAAALQAGEDQQSAKFSAAIAADAASVAASTAGLARASAHDAAVAAERAATWAAGAADELAEAAAASEDLVLKLYKLQTAGGPAAKESAVKALLTAAQAAAKAAHTLKHSLADAAPQTVRTTSASSSQTAQRSPPAPPAATADSDSGPASVSETQTDQEEQPTYGSNLPAAVSSVADADESGSAPSFEAADTRECVESGGIVSSSLDGASTVESTVDATIGPADDTADESTEQPIGGAAIKSAYEPTEDATAERADESAVVSAADEPAAEEATFDAGLESAVEPAEDLSEITRKDKVPDATLIIFKALHLTPLSVIRLCTHLYSVSVAFLVVCNRLPREWLFVHLQHLRATFDLKVCD